MTTKMRYVGAKDSQVLRTRDPRDVLIEGEEYEVRKIEVFAWHTDIYLKGLAGSFNSVCFEECDEA